MNSKINKSVERNVAIQIVAFSTIMIFLILSLISCIHTYSEKKNEILKELEQISTQIKQVITDHLTYSTYITNSIKQRVKNDLNNSKKMHLVLKEYFDLEESNHLFAWKELGWVNHDFLKSTTNRNEILSNPLYVDFIYNKSTNKAFIYATKHTIGHSSNLKIINNISDEKNKYLGSIMLTYDTNMVVYGLNKRKNNKSTNFMFINKDMDIIMHSKKNTENISDQHLINLLNNLKPQINQNMEDLFHIDMLSGANYFISPLKTFPFFIVVNIDQDIVKQNIYDSLGKKFIEILLLIFFSGTIIVTLYKREKALRIKAERSKLIATNATKSKSNFLSYTFHEIRSPLGFILTGSEFMKQELIGKMPKKYKTYVSGINQHAQTILNFIDDILDENQVIEGKFKITNTLSGIEDIIHQAIKNNLNKYKERKVKITSEIEYKLPLLVCDKRRILQALSNIISNSIKYTKNNNPIKITAKTVGSGMEIKVIDQGIGISEEDLPIALSAYGRLDNNECSTTSSYGLGLTIVKMIIDAHDAKIDIKSEKNQGTTVTITFPKYKLIHNSNDK